MTDFSRFNDERRSCDLLGSVTLVARAKALRILDINEEEDQYPYVGAVSLDGYIGIATDGGTCVVTPEGQVIESAYIRDETVLYRPSLQP